MASKHPAPPCLSQLHLCGGALARRLTAVVEATAEGLRLLRQIEWGNGRRSSGPSPVTGKEALSEPRAEPSFVPHAPEAGQSQAPIQLQTSDEAGMSNPRVCDLTSSRRRKFS